MSWRSHKMKKGDCENSEHNLATERRTTGIKQGGYKMKTFKRIRSNTARIFGLAAFAVAMSGILSSASAQTTFDVIGPREYDLPVGYEPFSVFVQYAYIQDHNKRFDQFGDKVDGSGAQQIVGMSKYVRFWTPEFSNKVGLAWEVIQPEISVRDRNSSTPNGSVSGFGDTLTGFAGWIKPTSNSTFGIQTFLQIPVGDRSVSDTNWKNLTSFLWDVRLPYNMGWTADAGWVWQGEKDDGTNPGTTFHTNQRFGWQIGGWIEPFLALDYEHIASYDGVPASWALDAGAGVMVSTFKNQSLTLRYSQSLDGKNHAYTDSWNFKYAVVW